MFTALQRFFLHYRVWRLQRAGLTIGPDCRFATMPEFGSEPYLITIGRHVSFAPEVMFVTHDGGTYVFREDPRYKHVIKYGRITIRDNCMIGCRVTILPGVTVGPNAVVGAGALVAHDVPANTVVAGNPARVVMGVAQYAEWCLAATPAYRADAYRRDKRAELLRLLPPVTIPQSAIPMAPSATPSKPSKPPTATAAAHSPV